MIFYKHKFPSGMSDKFNVRHKADNSVKLYRSLPRFKMKQLTFNKKA